MGVAANLARQQELAARIKKQHDESAGETWEETDREVLEALAADGAELAELVLAYAQRSHG